MKIFLILGLMSAASAVWAAGPAPVQKPFGANPQPSVVMGGAVVNAVPRGQDVPPAAVNVRPVVRNTGQGVGFRDVKLERQKHEFERRRQQGR